MFFTTARRRRSISRDRTSSRHDTLGVARGLPRGRPSPSPKSRGLMLAVRRTIDMDGIGTMLKPCIDNAIEVTGLFRGVCLPSARP